MLESIPGDPDSVLVLADALQASAVRLGATADAVRGLGPGAVWDGPAGTAFGGQVAALAPLLAAAADRSAGSAAACAPLPQPSTGRKQRSPGRWTSIWSPNVGMPRSRRRPYTLLTLGRTELDPEVIVVRQAQCGALAVQTDALATHRAAVADFGPLMPPVARPCGGRRRTRSVTPRHTGWCWVPPARAEPGPDQRARPAPSSGGCGGRVVGAGADAMLAGSGTKVVWDKVAVNVALAGVGSWGKVLKAGALAGSTRTVTRGAQRTSTVTGASMTTQDRLRAGCVRRSMTSPTACAVGAASRSSKLSAGESARVTRIRGPAEGPLARSGRSPARPGAGMVPACGGHRPGEDDPRPVGTRVRGRDQRQADVCRGCHPRGLRDRHRKGHRAGRGVPRRGPPTMMLGLSLGGCPLPRRFPPRT